MDKQPLTKMAVAHRLANALMRLGKNDFAGASRAAKEFLIDLDEWQRIRKDQPHENRTHKET